MSFIEVDWRQGYYSPGSVAALPWGWQKSDSIGQMKLDDGFPILSEGAARGVVLILAELHQLTANGRGETN